MPGAVPFLVQRKVRGRFGPRVTQPKGPYKGKLCKYALIDHETGIEVVPPSGANWTRAWHGCKLEAVYSIAYLGQLEESLGKDGTRTLWKNGEPVQGVYLYKDSKSNKILGYVGYVPLFEDGILWAVYWEVQCEHDKLIKANETDQWIHPKQSVKLMAMYLHGINVADLEFNTTVQYRWDP